MIHVIAAIEAKAGRRDELLTAFAQVIPLVRAEDGCLEYGVAVDVQTAIELQAPLRDNVVVVIEKWESVVALQDHLAAPHMAAHRTRTKDLVAGVTLQILQPA